MDGLIPDWQGMPDLLPDGMPNVAKTRAFRRWEEREALRNWVADQVGTMARTAEQEKRDAMEVARRVAQDCAARSAERKEGTMDTQLGQRLWEECQACHAWWCEGVESHHWWCPEVGDRKDGGGRGRG